MAGPTTGIGEQPPQSNFWKAPETERIKRISELKNLIKEKKPEAEKSVRKGFNPEDFVNTGEETKKIADKTLKKSIIHRSAEMVRNELQLEEVRNKLTEEQKARQESDKMAMYDSLTGLPTRKYFMDVLEITIREAERLDIPFSVVFMDLDGFKEVNDIYGHAAGDILLQEVAEVYKETFRTADIVARMGGDEFAALLFASRNGAAEKARSNIENTLVDRMRRRGINLNTSVTETAGVATHRKSLSANELLHQADIALFNGKRPKDHSSAKDRVVSYEEGMTMPKKAQRFIQT